MVKRHIPTTLFYVILLQNSVYSSQKTSHFHCHINHLLMFRKTVAIQALYGIQTKCLNAFCERNTETVNVNIQLTEILLWLLFLQWNLSVPQEPSIWVSVSKLKVQAGGTNRHHTTVLWKDSPKRQQSARLQRKCFEMYAVWSSDK